MRSARAGRWVILERELSIPEGIATAERICARRGRCDEMDVVEAAAEGGSLCTFISPPPGGAGASGAHTVTRSLARSPARVSCRFWAANEQLRKRGVLCRSEGRIRDWSFLPVGLTTATGHGLALCEGSTGAKAICGSGSVKPSTGGSGTSAPPNSGQSFG
jgi:hypothetical protein